MRFVVPQSVVGGRLREPSGSPAGAWRVRRFRRRPPVTDHRPPALSRRVHPLANARPLQSTAACCLPLRTTPKPPCDGPGSAERAPHLGFRALFATSAGSVHSVPGDPSSGLRSVRGVSHALDGLRHHRPCRLVSSRSRVRGSLLRGFPRRPAALAHHQPLPSCRYRRAPTPSKLDAPARAARLQGFAPIAGPLSPTSCLDSPTLDPLSSFHSLRFSSEHLGSAFALPPFMTFPASSSQ